MHDLTSPVIKLNKFPEMRPILENWVKLCRKYICEVHDDEYGGEKRQDLPWWYKERSQIGFLAAATWLSEGVALEEWSTTKKAVNGDRRKGRCDLWLKISGLRLNIEAKYVSVKLAKNTAPAVSTVKGRLKIAQNDASRLSCGKDEFRVGVLFAAPIVSHPKDDEAKARLCDWLEGLKKSNFLALAATFVLPQPNRKNMEDLWPGLVMIVGDARKAA